MGLIAGGTLPGEFVIFSQEGWQAQGFEMMVQQDLWGVGHDRAPASKPI